MKNVTKCNIIRRNLLPQFQIQLALYRNFEELIQLRRIVEEINAIVQHFRLIL